MYMSTKYILNILEKGAIKNLILMDGQITKSTYETLGDSYLDTIIDLSEEEKHNLTVSDNYIHSDDSIDIVKKKIVIEYGNKISSEMIYLFCMSKMYIDIDNVFNLLTQNRTIEIDKNRLFSFLLNIADINIHTIEEKETYDYEDLLKFKIYGEHLVKIPLGLSYNVESKYPFTVNPNDLVSVDPFLESYSTNIVSTQNKNLLLDYNIVENKLYVCFVDDIVKNVKMENKFLIQLYYPFIFSRGITSLLELEKNTTKMLTDEKKNINSNFLKNTQIVDMFYNIYRTRTTEIEKSNFGIQELHFIIHPVVDLMLPIDIIFKLLKTDERLPMTKYNTGSRSEKLYRLYSPHISKEGKKIPIIKKSKLFKLTTIVSREKSVGVFFEEDNIILILEFYINGNIKVKTICKEPTDYDILKGFLLKNINSIILPINEFIQNSGYKSITFSDFTENVEILDIKYTETIPITKNLNIKKYINCLSTIFVLLESDIKKGIEIDYKRVSHFNNMSSVEKFISRQLLRNDSNDDLINDIVENFSMTPENAAMELGKFLENVEVEQNLYKNRRLKIKTSSGFPISIVEDKYSNNIIVNVSNINNIKYLEIIKQFIDTFIRITQQLGQSKVSSETIDTECKKKFKEDIEVKDIVAISELPVDEPGELTITDGKLVFNQDDDNDEDGALDFLNEIYGTEEGEDDPEPEDDGSMMSELLGLTALGDDVLSEPTPEKPSELPSVVKPKTPIKSLDEEEDLSMIKDGMPLNNPNYFFERMYRRDPKLFLKRKEGKFEAYSRMCPGHWRRQPVIITQEEKDRIDKESPGSYGEGEHASLKYSSSPDKNYYYICPRYWCLKTNKSMTQEEVDSGECGGKIIPYEAKKVPKGAYIYEFNAGRKNNEHIDKDGNYMQHYPGFIKPDSHPDGLCIPCCMKNPGGKSQQSRRKQCLTGKIDSKLKPKKRGIQRLYVKEMTKFPLDDSDIAYLPLSVQKLFNVDNEKCRVSKKNNSLISGVPCLLRKGVLNTIQQQSFLYAIADMVGVTLSVLKKQLVHRMTIMDYMKLQNGSLIDIFYKEDTKLDYTLIQGDIFKGMNSEFVKKVLKSFSNYRTFILDDTVEINYTYTWDLVCNVAFDDKKNLIVVEVLEDDLTDNVDLICPTNHYSSNFFDTKNNSLIMIKKDIFYYPVYLFINDQESDENEIEVFQKEFNLSDKTLEENFKSSLVSISKYLSLCKPNKIKMDAYYFKDNINHEKLLEIILPKKYKILSQIINYDGKKIGFFVETPNGGKIYLPSNVSNVLPKIPLVDMNKLSIRRNLKDTVFELVEISKLGVPCKPVSKVSEDKLIVGIITETNQFVPIIEPEEDIDLLTIQTMSGLNTINIDTEIMLNKEKDKERTKIIQKIKLETNFYDSFRNTFRILINMGINVKKREKIKEIIETHDIYLKKLENIIKILNELLSSHVDFVVYEKSVLDSIKNVSPCISDTNCDEKVYCLRDLETDICKLLIPRSHLINAYNNEEVYFKRLADELIRYRHLKNYYFSKNKHTTLENIDYNLSENEIIILENILIGDYYLNVDILESNKYTKNTTREYINPISDVIFEDKINLKQVNAVEDDECISENNLLGTTEKWRPLLPRGTRILKIRNTEDCMFKIVSKILFHHSNTEINIDGIKQVLIEKYREMIEKESKNIYTTLEIQGKQNIIRKIKDSETSLIEQINSPSYYLTNLDLFILFTNFNVPVVFISGTKLKENNKTSFVINYSPDVRYYYVLKQYGIILNTVQKYGILMFDRDIKIDLISLDNDLSENLQKNNLKQPFIKKKRIKLIEK